MRMFPLTFEEFLVANGVGQDAIDTLRNKYDAGESPDEGTHRYIMDLMRKYLLVGGLPDAVNTFIETDNMAKVRTIQNDIRELYIADAVKYEESNSGKLKIAKIYRMIPSFMESKKKRVVAKEIDEKKGARYENYLDEFEYLISSGIALDAKAITTPAFPVSGASTKNLLKLYLNDVGLLTGVLYRNNIRAVLDDEASINLGAVYETVAAQELAAQGNELYYFDRKKEGEVDFVIDDYSALQALPIEIKSGRDYTIHSAINKFVSNKDYNVNRGIVLSNEREVFDKDGITHMPFYYVMFVGTQGLN